MPTIYVLVNGRTRAVCGVYSDHELAVIAATEYKIDSWHIVERKLDVPPVQLA